MRVDSILELIGQTPLIRLQQASERTGWQVYGKWEAKNPGGSVKDRIAWAMIRAAEAKGQLAPGGTIVEPTSGNTGIGLAMVAAARGYRCILTMPETASLERRAMMAGFGAELVLTPGSEGMSGAIRQAEALVAEIPGAIMLQQFENPANPEVHYHTTGPEIWQDTDGQVTALVAGIGTGGTITGAGQFLKEKNPALHLIGVEPAESAILSGGHPGPHRIQGIGAGFIPRVLNRQLIDRVVPVPDSAAIARAQDVMRQEGLPIGISGGAAVWAAEHALPQIGSTGMAVVILPDYAERYLSTALFREGSR